MIFERAIVFARLLAVCGFILCVGDVGVASAQGLSSAPPLDVPNVQLPPAVEAGRKLTLAQAETAALTQNPQIAVSQHTVAAAHANLESQRAFMNPTLNYSGLNNSVAKTDFRNPSNYNVYVPIEVNGAEHYRANQAKFQLRGAEAGALTTTISLKQAVGDAYSGLQVADSQLENEEYVYGLVAKLRDLTQKQFELGSGTQVNAIRAQVALTQEQQNLIAAASQVITARAALDAQLGRPADSPIDAAEPLAYRAGTIPDRATLLAAAMKMRPEIALADAGVNAAHANIGLQKAAYAPDVTLGKQPDGTPVEVGAVLPMDLGSIRGAVDNAREEAKVQEATAAQARLGVALDIENACTTVTQAQQALQLYELGVLPQTEDLLNRVTQGFALGSATILDVIDAEQAYRSTRNSYYAAIGAYNQAVDQLNRAVGGSFEQAPTGAGK